MSGINIAPSETNLFTIVNAILQLAQGRSNAVGEVTLRASQTTTVVTKNESVAAVNVAVGAEIFLSPRTAHAAAALPTTYISSVGQGTFTISHASDAQTDKTFGWMVSG